MRQRLLVSESRTGLYKHRLYVNLDLDHALPESRPTLGFLPVWTIAWQPRFDGGRFFTGMGLEQGITYRSEGFELRWGELRDGVGVVDMDHIVFKVWHGVVGN